MKTDSLRSGAQSCLTGNFYGLTRKRRGMPYIIPTIQMQARLLFRKHWMGAKESGEDYALEFAAVDVEEVEKTTVALESSEDYSEPGIGFYTHQYQMAGMECVTVL